ncbi:glycosyltransferase family 2 protein [Gymnodinialimonas sp.]
MAIPPPVSRSVMILLATYQGARFLGEQIRSLYDQSVPDISIFASDDGSTDQTLEVLQEAQTNWDKGEFHIRSGPGVGYRSNFRSIALRCDLNSDYYAFCDQDDIWDADKLERALRWSAKFDPEIPQVYSSRTRWIDESGKFLRISHAFGREPSFANALVQTIAGGNTMVMNQAAMKLFRKTAESVGPVSHDGWLYLIVTGAGGIFHFSDEASVSYRQHNASVSGVPTPLTSWMWRLSERQRAGMRQAIDKKITALESCIDHLTPEARLVLKEYKASRNGASVFKRIRALKKSGVYARTFRSNVAMHVDCLFRVT